MAETIGEVIANSLRRVMKSNFQREKATDAERERLSNAPQPVKNPLAQDYSAWRRAAMNIGAVALIVWSVIELSSYEESADRTLDQAVRLAEVQVGRRLTADERTQVRDNAREQIRLIGTDNFELIDTVKMLISLSILVGAIFLVMAAKNWHRIRASRRWARMSLYIIFLTPFILAAIPFTAIMDFPNLPAKTRTTVTMALGLELGFYLFMLVGPRALALFPGVVRSSITLKTLIPESPLTGWAATIMSMFYPIFLIVIVAFLNQITGNMLLLAGLVCLVIAPMIYVYNAKEIMRPHTAEDVQKVVVGIRMKVVIFNLLGAVLLCIFVFDIAFFSMWDAIRFIASFVGNFMLVTLVASDLILALMRAGHEQTLQFEGSDLQKSLSDKFADLAGVGLTDLKAVKEADAGA